MTAVRVVAIGTIVVTLREIKAGARIGHHGRDAIAVHAVAHGVAVAVPVADDARQSGRHGFQWRQAERLLHIVRERDEDVGGGPGVKLVRRHAAVQHGQRHGWAQLRGRLVEGLVDGLVDEPAAQHEVDAAAVLRRLAECREHLLRMGLGVERQAAEKQKDDVAGLDAQAPAHGIAAGAFDVEVGRVHAERNQGQLRQLEALGAEARAEVLGLALQHAAHAVAHDARRADHGIPTAHGRHEQVREARHHRVAGRRVRDAAQAVAARAGGLASHQARTGRGVAVGGIVECEAVRHAASSSTGRTSGSGWSRSR
jgi:hypothetical protein